MHYFRRLSLYLTTTVAAATALLGGCSGSGEDVRVTLCKDILLTQVGSSAVIDGVDTQTRGYEYAAVRVGFTNQGRRAQAICYYNHDAVEDTADQIADPLAAYATSPFQVVIDGQKLSKSGLAEAIKQAMLKQGRGLVDRAKQGIEDAAQR
jgi:hypothetical protein